MLKKISAFLLSVTMVLSLFASSFSSLAVAEDITLPDNVYVEKEVTKDISLSDMKLVYFRVDGSPAGDATFTQQAFQDHIVKENTLLTDGQQLVFTKEEMLEAASTASTWAEGSWLAFYPLTEDQTLKSFSYNTKKSNEDYYPNLAIPNSKGFNIYRITSINTDTAVVKASKVSSTTVTDTVLSEYVANPDKSSGSYTGGNIVNVNFEAFFGGDGFTASGEKKYEFDYTTNGVVKTKLSNIEKDNNYFTSEFTNYFTKNYPIVVGQIKSNGAHYNCFANMQITYTDKVDITTEVKEFVAANRLALDIKNGTVDYNNTGIAEAQALKAAYEGLEGFTLANGTKITAEEYKAALVENGYYNEAAVQRIINIAGVTLPNNEHIFAEKVVTKNISLSDMKLVYFRVDGSPAGDATFTQQAFQDHIVKENTLLTGGQQLVFTTEEMLKAASTASAWAEGLWLAFYPLTADQTLKSFSYNTRKTQEDNYINLAYSTSVGLRADRLSCDTSGYMKTQQLCATNINDEVLKNFGENASGSYRTAGSSGSTTLEGVSFGVGADGTTAFYAGISNFTKNVVLDYTTDGVVKTTVTKVKSGTAGDGAYFTKDYDNYFSKNYPIVTGQIKSDGAHVNCFADMVITYTEPVDITGVVKEFVAANPFALDIRNDNVDYANIKDEDKAKATELKAAYEGLEGFTLADGSVVTAEAFKTALEKYGYCNTANVNSIINGGVVTDEAYVPTLVSATIKASSKNQDIRFKATISNEAIAGRTVAEFGMIIADYRNITNGTLTVNDLTYNSASDKVIVAKKTGADNGYLGQTFYVNIGGLDTNTYGVPFIARAYVKYTNGQVCYSTNTNATGDYVARTGVKDGCAVRSVISIAKAMIVALSKKTDVSSVAIVENDVITYYVDENGEQKTSPTDNGTSLFKFIIDNRGYLEVDDWSTDGVLKILTIGNSFSVDAMQYVWQIANDLGVEASLGNLYIGGCSLGKHATNAQNDAAAYTYYTNSDGTWSSTDDYKMSDAILSENWDFISLQQQSGISGVADYYDGLEYMINYVKELCPDAKIVWHMTWAYPEKDGWTATYYSDQMAMYNAITDVVQNTVCSYEDIYKIIPCGTAIQNVRSSYIGDTLNRDGLHLSYGFGRYVAGLTFVHALTGMSIENVTYKPSDTDANMLKVAIEAVTNAVENPYSVTDSQYTLDPDKVN